MKTGKFGFRGLIGLTVCIFALIWTGCDNNKNDGDDGLFLTGISISGGNEVMAGLNAGETGGRITLEADPLPATAEDGPYDWTWYLRASNSFADDSEVTAAAINALTGVLTAGGGLAADTPVWVFAREEEKNITSAGYRVTVKRYMLTSVAVIGPTAFVPGVKLTMAAAFQPSSPTAPHLQWYLKASNDFTDTAAVSAAAINVNTGEITPNIGNAADTQLWVFVTDEFGDIKSDGYPIMVKKHEADGLLWDWVSTRDVNAVFTNPGRPGFLTDNRYGMKNENPSTYVITFNPGGYVHAGNGRLLVGTDSRADTAGAYHPGAAFNFGTTGFIKISVDIVRRAGSGNFTIRLNDSANQGANPHGSGSTRASGADLVNNVPYTLDYVADLAALAAQNNTSRDALSSSFFQLHGGSNSEWTVSAIRVERLSQRPVIQAEGITIIGPYSLWSGQNAGDTNGDKQIRLTANPIPTDAEDGPFPWEWSISATQTYSAGTSVSGVASIVSSSTENGRTQIVLTSAPNLSSVTKVYVFAKHNDLVSAPWEVTVRPWVDRSTPLVWEWKVSEETGNYTFPTRYYTNEIKGYHWTLQNEDGNRITVDNKGARLLSTNIRLIVGLDNGPPAKVDTTSNQHQEGEFYFGTTGTLRVTVDYYSNVRLAITMNNSTFATNSNNDGGTSNHGSSAGANGSTTQVHSATALPSHGLGTLWKMSDPSPGGPLGQDFNLIERVTMVYEQDLAALAARNTSSADALYKSFLHFHTPASGVVPPTVTSTVLVIEGIKVEVIP